MTNAELSIAHNTDLGELMQLVVRDHMHMLQQYNRQDHVLALIGIYLAAFSITAAAANEGTAELKIPASFSTWTKNIIVVLNGVMSIRLPRLPTYSSGGLCACVCVHSVWEVSIHQSQFTGL